MTRRRAWLVLLLSVLALGATVAVRPPQAPPLYDGLGFPDEPYRWVSPPAGQARTAQAPTPASATVDVVDGASMSVRAFSGEQGPQVAVATPGGAFAPPAGVTSVRVSATPQAPPATAPAGATVVSNLYRLDVTTATGGGTTTVPLAEGAKVVVNLRAYEATPLPVVIGQWDGSAWTQLPTRQVGTEIYAAELPSLEPFAVLRFGAGASPTVAAATGQAPGPAASGPATAPAGGDDGSGVSGTTLGLIVGGIVVVLLAGLVVLRRRTAED